MWDTLRGQLQRLNTASIGKYIVCIYIYICGGETERDTARELYIVETACCACFVSVLVGVVLRNLFVFFLALNRNFRPLQFTMATSAKCYAPKKLAWTQKMHPSGNKKWRRSTIFIIIPPERRPTSQKHPLSDPTCDGLSSWKAGVIDASSDMAMHLGCLNTQRADSVRKDQEVVLGMGRIHGFLWIFLGWIICQVPGTCQYDICRTPKSVHFCGQNGSTRSPVDTDIQLVNPTSTTYWIENDWRAM